MSDIVQSYNIIIDTERNLSPDSVGDNVNLPLGESPIVAGSNQQIRLCLNEFTIAKTWTDINSSNNAFTIRDNVGAITAEIPVNNYSTGYDVVKAWADYMKGGAGGTAVTGYRALSTYNSNPISYTINNPPANSDIDSNNMKLDVTFTWSGGHGYPSGDQPIIQSFVSQGKSYQILGGKRVVNNGDFTTQTLDTSWVDVNNLRVTGFWNTQTTSENYCYLRINEQNINTQTSSLNSIGVDTKRTSMTNSNILGIVPINQDYCRYVAQTDNVFFTTILAKQVAQMRVFVTDSLGEPFPLMSPNQNTLGNRFFTAIIRVDIIQLHPSIPHSVHNPNLDEKTQPQFSTEPATTMGIVNTAGKNGPQAGFYGNGFYNFQGRQIS